MTSVPQTSPAGGKASSILRGLAAGLLAAGALAGMIWGAPEETPFLAAGFGVAAIAAISRSPRRMRLYLLRDALALALLAFMARGGLEAWQAPSRWLDVVHLTPVGGSFAVALYLAAAIAGARGPEGALSNRMGAFLVGLPLLLKGLFVLTAPKLLMGLATAISAGLIADPNLLLIAGRALVLFIVAECVVLGLGVVLDQRLSRDLKLHALILGAAAFTAATPLIADWGGAAGLVTLPLALQLSGVIVTTIVAQGGLWSLTFLLTGSIIDALRGRRPSFASCAPQWREGLYKGAIYGGVFMALLHAIALLRASPFWADALKLSPIFAFAGTGMLAFPLAKTVVESFDGSKPFFERLRDAYRAPWAYARGLVLGLGAGLLAADIVPFGTGQERLVFGLAMGAVAYAGVDLIRDAAQILAGRRGQLQSARVYILGAGLGALAGAALASYFDVAQIATVARKFAQYVAVNYPAAGLETAHYVIYPLFSKWGATDLGLVTGGARLFFNESLSGVINWSFAAPLFSINLVLLTALMQRDVGPIHRLLGRSGLSDLVEQAFRVQRWGLWMAPVIYSFLRLAPEPTWYNQDGAVRTIAATIMSVRLGPGEFHDWSLTLFLGLLAYDWLRVIVWFDHMGLRVASLVNASFVVGDWLDEKAAAWLGHGARTRVIPEGLRRFATWAPLLIPFYIPRGAEWDNVWRQAATLHDQGGPLLAPVRMLLFGYVVFGLLIAAGLGLAALIRRHVRHAGPPARAPAPFVLSNGSMTFEVNAQGRGHMRVTSALRTGACLDLTPRETSPYDGRGALFFLREEGKLLATLTGTPKAAQGRLDVAHPSPTSLSFTTTLPGLSIEAQASVPRGVPLVLWRLRLRNTGTQARTLRLASFREIVLSDWDSYDRYRAYQALFVGTAFVPQLTAIIAHNRRLRSHGAAKTRIQLQREVMVHAAAFAPDSGVRLVGYQDSRACFLGLGTGDAPGALMPEVWLSPDDAGTAFTFDPAACLDLEVPLPVGATVEIRFADGYATSEAEAADLIARHLKTPSLAPAALAPILERVRPTRDRCDCRAHENGTFAQDGKSLAVGVDTMRVFSHVLANPAGDGAVVGNDGMVFSFARNSQQNGLTPFIADTIPAQRVGQCLYVRDLDTGEMLSPGFVPLRRADATHRTIFGQGYARQDAQAGTLSLEHLIILPPDAPVELRLLTLRNQSATPKRYRVSAYFEMILAQTPLESRGKIEVREDLVPAALFFANPKNDFVTGTAFVATSLKEPEWESWRGRFVGGAGRDLASPLFAESAVPDDLLFDDEARIAAFAGTITVPAGGEAKIALVLGQCETIEEALPLIEAYADPQRVEYAFAETQSYWKDFCGTLRIETNSTEFDRLVNDWLPYQIVASRLWGRLGPSQRSGGFGFRDQLQDVLPLTLISPELARAQILLHACQQFLDGDVLQWWHADKDGKTGLGARNRASDPHLWLPYLVARYIEVTGDAAILDEPVRYLEGIPIPPGQEGIAFASRPSRDVAPLYEHCCRAIARALKAEGAHGLPLMGTGDWNDGLSEVGAKGRGESVWLGFFLLGVIQDFAPLAASRGDEAASALYRAHAQKLRASLDAMWRGERFVRAINDKGEELCFADALMASWPVLAGAVGPERGRTLLEAGLRDLEKDGLVVLLDPPFTAKSKPAAGRISDYPPGVRENGGQYSHGVSWLVDALAKLADETEAGGDRASAQALRAKAAQIWIKISPLGRHDDGERDVYGLPPHQQPADIYFGPGYERRGGWGWYTGAAARMLWGAYALLGIGMERGELKIAPHAFTPRGPLTLKAVSFKGRVYSAEKKEAGASS
jgi:cyclic beta-1,2-glucan synthetase